MRLTLRTLLAYLDDLLEPTEAKEIGEKIKNSKDATDLIARIQEVMRRRRLTTPDIDNPDAGLDPNTVAEYLNNVLSSDQIVDVEKVLLESDVHLAEVAATQQIMTHVLSEPIEPSQQSLERMYALIPSTGETTQQTTAQPASTENGQPASSTSEKSSERIDQAQTTVAEPKSFEEGIPDYLKRTPLWRRLFSYGAAVAITLLWVALLVYGNPFSSSDVNQVDDPPNNQVALQEPQPKLDDLPEVVPPKENIPAKVEPVQNNDPKKMPEENPKVDIVKNPLPVIAQIPVAMIPAVQPVVPPQIKLMPATPLQYTSNSGLLLRHDTNKKGWYVMPRRAMIHPGETIASPQPFTSSIKVGDDLCEVTLLGQTAARTLAPTETTSWGISIVQGRMLIETKLDKETFPKEGITFTLASHQHVWQLKLTSPETICGVEIVLHQPDGLDQKPPANLFSGNLYVGSGSAQLTDAKGKVIKATPGYSTSLIAEPPKDKKGDAPDVPVPVTPPPLVTLPDWLEFNKTTPSLTIRKYANLFEKEFDIDQSVSLNIPPMVSDSKPKIAELAVQCLALTRNISELVRALAQSEHEEARLAAIVGLRSWLGTTSNTSELLRKELAMVFSKEDADSIYRLLWGYAQNDGTDRATSNQLVSWLGSDHVAIRELTFLYVQELADHKHGYRPLASPMQRDSAIRRWRQHVEKNNGLHKK